MLRAVESPSPNPTLTKSKKKANTHIQNKKINIYEEEDSIKVLEYPIDVYIR